MTVQVCPERVRTQESQGTPQWRQGQKIGENSIDGTKVMRESGTQRHGGSGGMGGDRGAKENEKEIQIDRGAER